MKEHKNFWDKNAGRYDRFMQKDRAAYDEMYVLIRPVVKAKTVLELATGTGLIAKHIVNAAALVEATDASAEMIAEAKRDNHSAKLHFSAQDMFRLPYANQSFVKAFFMKLAGFPLHSKWTSEEYLRFLGQNGWTVRKSAVLKASFPLTYAECVKSEV